MKKQIPLKRNPAIVSFSKDHHFGLLLAWKIRQGLKNNISPERIGRYAVYFFREDLENHFRDEEKMLFHKLHPGDPLRTRAEREHGVIDHLVNSLEAATGDPGILEKLADELEKHIRFEERELFNHIQQNVGVDELREGSERVHGNSRAIDDKWEDIFWEIKTS